MQKNTKSIFEKKKNIFDVCSVSISNNCRFSFPCGKFQISEYSGLIATLHKEIRKFFTTNMSLTSEVTLHYITQLYYILDITLEIIPKFKVHFTSTLPFWIRSIIYKFTNIKRATVSSAILILVALLSVNQTIINILICIYREIFVQYKHWQAVLFIKLKKIKKKIYVGIEGNIFPI